MVKSKGRFSPPWLTVYIILLLALLFYTRFVGLDWGLPYPMHPDERNMAVALQQLNCKEFSNLRECFNPHFFAYGQFPIYFGYGLAGVYHFVTGQLGVPITFPEATMALRIISAISSILAVYLGVKIVFTLYAVSSKLQFKIQNFLQIKHAVFIPLILFIFSPVLIQFAHFGTTESLLMLLYLAIIYVTYKFLLQQTFQVTRYIIYASMLCGLAVSTKVSSVIFLAVPIYAILLYKPFRIKGVLMRFLILGAGSTVFAVIFSPHNLLNLGDYLNTIRYESAIGLGEIVPFYTRQFFDTTPVLFQFEKIFPYALGWPIFMLFIVGFFVLPWNKSINLLRIAFLTAFIPNAILYAKWTRFMAPAFPVMIIIVSLTLLRAYEFCLRLKAQKSKLQIKMQKFCIFAFYFLIFALSLPGIAYLSIYRESDIRLQASQWIYENIPDGSYILSETANVVDIPIQSLEFRVQNRNYSVVSFDFYQVDEDPGLQTELLSHISRADYIFVPSRRVWANHTCYKFKTQNSKRCKSLRQRYPVLDAYYEKLFSGQSFEQVAEFSAHPTVELLDFRFSIPDENAEETWTVFDHPVIRIFKRV